MTSAPILSHAESLRRLLGLNRGRGLAHSLGLTYQLRKTVGKGGEQSCDD
jgi:hypothetical protein